jgi:hypothetical protein
MYFTIVPAAEYSARKENWVTDYIVCSCSGRKIALIDRFVSTMSQLKSSEPAVKFYETIGRILLQTVEACFHPRDKVVDCIERTAAICGSVPLAVKMQPKMWVRLESMRMASSALLHAMVGNITEALQVCSSYFASDFLWHI